MKNGVAIVGLIVMSVGAGIEWWAYLSPIGVDIPTVLDGVMVAMLGALIVMISIIPSLLTRERKNA